MMEPVEENQLMIRDLNPDNEILDPLDKLSQNPIHLLQHILSFMPDNDAAKTSILSRKWRRVRRQSSLKLSLKNCSLDDKEFQKMFDTDFYGVEKLSLKDCTGLKKLVLSSYKLRKVKLTNCIGLEKAEMVVQNLEVFFFYASSPCEAVFPVSKSLTCLSLVGASITNKTFEDNISKFPLLEILELGNCPTLDNIRISSPNLKELFLIDCSRLKEIKLDTPNLDYFMVGRCNFASFLSSNSLDMVNVTIRLEDPDVPAALSFRRSMFLLSNFNHCRLLTLHCKSDQNIVIRKEVRESLTPPLYGLKHLLVETESLPVNLVALVDNMLWTCPRLDSLRIWWPFSNNALLFQYEDLRGGDNYYPCCTNHPLKCWRHTLRKVTLLMNSKKEARNLKKYFIRNLRDLGHNIDVQIILPFTFYI